MRVSVFACVCIHVPQRVRGQLRASIFSFHQVGVGKYLNLLNRSHDVTSKA